MYEVIMEFKSCVAKGLDYSYLVPDRVELKLGDTIIVPIKRENNHENDGYAIATVAGINRDFSEAIKRGTKFRWVGAKVSFSQYENRLSSINEAGCAVDNYCIDDSCIGDCGLDKPPKDKPKNYCDDDSCVGNCGSDKQPKRQEWCYYLNNEN